MAELLVGEKNIFPYLGIAYSVNDLENFKTYGYMYAYVAVGLGNEGFVLCFPFQLVKPGAALQIYISYENSYRKIRIWNWSDRIWTDWVDL